MDSILEVTGINQRFGGVVALCDVNMNIRQNEIVGVIGPNGAGKTTLFNVITGIYRPDQGSVFLKGADITGKKPFEIAAMGFARTFQNIRLFKMMTVLDNVLVGMHTRTKAGLLQALLQTRGLIEEQKAAEKKAIEILELLGLAHARYQLAKNLSYGSQRKLEIARALATDPSLLLLDEPAAGMNEHETKDLLNIILQLKDMGHTILLIEHDMKFVMNICERIYVLDHGVQIGEGSPEAVKKNQVVIEAYLGKEFDDDNHVEYRQSKCEL